MSAACRTDAGGLTLFNVCVVLEFSACKNLPTCCQVQLLQQDDALLKIMVEGMPTHMDIFV